MLSGSPGGTRCPYLPPSRYFRRSAGAIGADHRTATGKGFDQAVGKPFPDGREHEYSSSVHIGIRVLDKSRQLNIIRPARSSCTRLSRYERSSPSPRIISRAGFVARNRAKALINVPKSFCRVKRPTPRTTGASPGENHGWSSVCPASSIRRGEMVGLGIVRILPAGIPM